jgi:four helix bundle protein
VKRFYNLTKKAAFARDFGLKGQIQDAAGSSMHNIAEGFDAETNAEFLRFLRYAKRSCTEVQSQLYVALDQQYITNAEFQEVYDHAARTRAAIRGFTRLPCEICEHMENISYWSCSAHTRVNMSLLRRERAGQILASV